jgi:dihydroflavonol-4-reductase
MWFSCFLGLFKVLIPYFYCMILVTGATGLVGGHLLYRFRESGNNIIAIYRTWDTLDKTREIFESYEKGAGALVDQFQWKQADILEVPSLETAMKGVTQVYHCAAAIDGKDFEGLKNVNMRGTENTINVALAAGVVKFCHVSSIAALGDAVGDKAVSEKDYFNLDGNNTNYAITKFGAEMEAWRATQERMEVVIVNPGIVVGEGSWSAGSGKFFSKTAAGNYFYTAGASGFVDVRDVTRAMQELMESDINGERFILVGENLSYKTVLDHIAHSLDVKKPAIRLGAFVLYFISAILKLPDIFGFQRRLSRATVHSMVSRTAYNNEKIKKSIHFTFSPILDTIDRVAAFYRTKH